MSQGRRKNERRTGVYVLINEDSERFFLFRRRPVLVAGLTINRGLGRSLRPGGGIGRRKGLKIPRDLTPVPVRFRPRAPKKQRSPRVFNKYLM